MGLPPLLPDVSISSVKPSPKNLGELLFRGTLSEEPQKTPSALSQQFSQALYRIRATVLHLLKKDTPEEIRLREKFSQGTTWKEVEPLLAKGADINRSVRDLATPPPWIKFKDEAAKNVARMQLLLASGADPNIRNTTAKQTRLFYVRDAATARLLLAAGADPTVKDSSGFTPLHRSQGVDIAKTLLNAGADPNAQNGIGLTPLHIIKDVEIVKHLLARGADPNISDLYGTTPLMNASNVVHTQMLLAAGANPHVSNRYGFTPLHKSLSFEMAQRLLAVGVNVNTQNQNGDTPLHDASGPLIPSLLAAGANPNKQNKLGNTPLHGLQNVQALLAAGADPTIENEDGLTPLDKASLQGDTAKLTALKKAGGKPRGLFSYFISPSDFWADWQQAQDRYSVEYLAKIWDAVEYKTTLRMGRALLPELLALLGPYLQKVQQMEEKADQPKYTSIASAALTRLYQFIEHRAIRKLDSSALNTWAQVGALGMGFNRWKWDAAVPYKGMGPMEASPLLVQSGLFQPLPPREDDAVYGPALAYTDPDFGLSVELRRAYIAVSLPETGTLVIRNSSHHFGRDLFPEPAYYSRIDLPEGVWVNPQDLLQDNNYHSVLAKELHRTLKEQQVNHQKMQSLLKTLEAVLESYADWTSGFEAGQAPPGFMPLLQLALESARGYQPPFRRGKPTRLTWVHPYEPPKALLSFDLARPSHPKEAQALLSVLQRKAPNSILAQQAPTLIDFLAQGASQGWQLILTEA